MIINPFKGKKCEFDIEDTFQNRYNNNGSYMQSYMGLLISITSEIEWTIEEENEDSYTFYFGENKNRDKYYFSQDFVEVVR